MPANMVLLEKITVGAEGASSVTFSSIPQTGYTDLVIKMSARSNRNDGSDWVRIDVNGVNSSYTDRKLLGDGTNASSQTNAGTIGFTIDASSATASTFANSEIYIPNYASANYKSFSIDTVSENNATTAYQLIVAGLWSSTSAITSLKLVPNYGTGFLQYSTFYLYGVAKLGTTPAIVPYATGGDTIMTDGTYWYHTFVSSGTFTPAKAITCDYLVVGGGAGGKNYAGGGAGRVDYLTSQLLTTTNYSVTIGGGGGINTAGTSSVFNSTTATGGSAGATDYTGGISGNGFAGGTGKAGSSNSDPWLGGGGAGSAAVGGNYAGNVAGAGGIGVSNSITGTATRYGGGGGGGCEGSAGSGGAGGLGGGGTGSNPVSNSSTAGTANTGGGGGGGDGGNTNGGKAGGSGLVIVRYAV
jgi:hypothetical protein